LGLRGIFVHARSIAVVVSGLSKVESLQFGERSALALPASRRIIKEMYRRLKEKVDGKR
jgi:diphthamide biosynthesis methyltransferase